LEDLDKNRFAMGSLFGKLLFVDDDVRAGARLPDGVLKTISEAKEVTGEVPALLQLCRSNGAALDERGPATGVIRHRTALLLEQHHDVQTILRHVDSAKREHLRIPSLLMRARAHATVRVWKKRLELQAHSRTQVRSDCGLPVATGAVP
jgi:hypothetical protein